MNTITQQGSHTFSVEVDGITYYAELRNDELVWSDGDVWQRVEAIVEPTECLETDLGHDKCPSIDHDQSPETCMVHNKFVCAEAPAPPHLGHGKSAPAVSSDTCPDITTSTNTIGIGVDQPPPAHGEQAPLEYGTRVRQKSTGLICKIITKDVKKGYLTDIKGGRYVKPDDLELAEKAAEAASLDMATSLASGVEKDGTEVASPLRKRSRTEPKPRKSLDTDMWRQLQRRYVSDEEEYTQECFQAYADILADIAPPC